MKRYDVVSKSLVLLLNVIIIISSGCSNKIISTPDTKKPAITILESNKYPGLGIGTLHKRGITGNGINIGIIDSPLLLEQIEFKGRIKYYEEIGYSNAQPNSHACGVTSIAAGKTTGVAPDAGIYYIAAQIMDTSLSTATTQVADYNYYAEAIRKLIQINTGLKDNEKIRVISISAGWSPQNKGYKEITEAIKDATKLGIFVVSSNMFDYYGNKFYFHGLSIDALSDRDKFENYKVIDWPRWISLVENKDGFDKCYIDIFEKNLPEEQLLIPIESKTVAGNKSNTEYILTNQGGWSWCIPYIAGVFALACQVKPDMNAELFWSMALKTGESRTIIKGERQFTGKIINPQKLIESLEKNN